MDNLLPQERAQVLEWGTGAKDTIRNCCLHELVEEQARIRPDAIALINNCGKEKMTYGELNAKAHRLAVELQKRGVKPNSFVGILMGGEKTFEMCVAVLGVTHGNFVDGYSSCRVWSAVGGNSDINDIIDLVDTRFELYP